MNNISFTIQSSVIQRVIGPAGCNGERADNGCGTVLAQSQNLIGCVADPRDVSDRS
jgi:hypothetical protein